MKKNNRHLPSHLRFLLKIILSVDSRLAKLIYIKLFQIYITFKTGNVKLWKKIKNEESKNMDFITSSIKEQKALEEVQKKINNF